MTRDANVRRARSLNLTHGEAERRSSRPGEGSGCGQRRSSCPACTLPRRMPTHLACLPLLHPLRLQASPTPWSS